MLGCLLQEGSPAEEDLKNWGHHCGAATVPDEIMQSVCKDLPGSVSFVFTCEVNSISKPYRLHVCLDNCLLQAE